MYIYIYIGISYISICIHIPSDFSRTEQAYASLILISNCRGLDQGWQENEVRNADDADDAGCLPVYKEASWERCTKNSLSGTAKSGETLYITAYSAYSFFHHASVENGDSSLAVFWKR